MRITSNGWHIEEKTPGVVEGQLTERKAGKLPFSVFISFRGVHAGQQLQ